MILSKISFASFLLLAVVGRTSAEDELGEAASLFSGPIEEVVSGMVITFPESPLVSESGGYVLFSDVKWVDTEEGSPTFGKACGMIWKWDIATEQLSKLLKCSGLVGPPGDDADENGLPPKLDVAIEYGSNGLTWGWDGEGSLHINQHGWKRIVHVQVDDIDEDNSSVDPAKVEILAVKYNGFQLNAPNDLDLADNGLLYFSDPPFGRQYTDGMPNPFAASFDEGPQVPSVYFLVEDARLRGLEPVRLLEFPVADDPEMRSGPNGVGVNDANGDLAVAITDFSIPRVEIYARNNEDGTSYDPEPKKVLFTDKTYEGAPVNLVDGLTFDTDLGVLFVSGPGGVYIYDAEDDGDYDSLGFLRLDDLCTNNVVGAGYLWITCNGRGLLRIPLAEDISDSDSSDSEDSESSEDSED